MGFFDDDEALRKRVEGRAREIRGAEPGVSRFELQRRLELELKPAGRFAGGTADIINVRTIVSLASKLGRAAVDSVRGKSENHLRDLVAGVLRQTFPDLVE